VTRAVRLAQRHRGRPAQPPRHLDRPARRSRVEKIRWNVKNAWPSKWTGPSFDATSDALAIETLELTHEGVVVQKW